MKKKNYCIICGKDRKSKNPNISYIFQKTVSIKTLSIICSKFKNED